MIEITQDPILPEAAINCVRNNAYGAVIAYVGTVRDMSHGKKVLFLEHQDSLKELARKELERIAGEIQVKWSLDDVVIFHRIGKLRVGEILLVVAIGAPHRQEAFEACQYAVDQFKQVASRWTTEVTAEDE